MKLLSLVIPALNERAGLEVVLSSIPRAKLEALRYCVEVIVVDGGSADGTVELAKSWGAEVMVEPIRGYGRALKSGFGRSTGDVILVADADGTYPLEEVPEFLRILEEQNLDFLIANRLGASDGAMRGWNRVGNMLLAYATLVCFGLRMSDPESGMWLFRRTLLPRLRMVSDNWSFSHEMKIEACYYARARWKEVTIKYRPRLGETKLRNIWRVGFSDLIDIAAMRLTRGGLS